MFLQNLMIAAHARGLATCPQVSCVRYQSVIAHHLGLAPDESVVCAMSLGHPDEDDPLNQMAMPREPIEELRELVRLLRLSPPRGGPFFIS